MVDVSMIPVVTIIIAVVFYDYDGYCSDSSCGS